MSTNTLRKKNQKASSNFEESEKLFLHAPPCPDLCQNQLSYFLTHVSPTKFCRYPFSKKIKWKQMDRGEKMTSLAEV